MLSTSSYGWDPFQISPADGFDYTHPDFGPQSLIVFQRQTDISGTPSGTPEVWLYDPNAGSTPATRISLIISNASSPALSPDGQHVAFVQSDGTHDQIRVSDMAGGNIVDVTSDANDHDNPAWSPNGATLAFNIGTTVATGPADGSGAASPTTVPGLSGLPAYQTQNKTFVVRLAGSDRYATAIATSQSYWATAGNPSDTRASASAVVLTRSDTFADALAGSALAAAKQGPLLMTPTTSLKAGVKAEINRVLGTGPATVYLLGSTAAVSQAVQDEIDAMGYTTVRLAGHDRYATAIAIANAINPTPDLVLAATGKNFPDALAAGAAAGSYDVPGVAPWSAVVVLTADSTLPTVTRDYLNTATSQGAVVFGVGSKAVSATADFSPINLGGSNRYETALFVAETFFAGEHYEGIATGSNWPDALAGGALMATVNGPVLLTPTGGTAGEILNANSAFHLDVTCGSIHGALVFGGTSTVSASVENQAGDWISGPAGFQTSLNSIGLFAAPKLRATSQPSTTKPSGDRRSPAELMKAAATVTRQR